MSAADASDAVWIEAESPAAVPAPFNTGGWGRADALSAQKWLHAAVDADKVAAVLPEQGLVLEYNFTSKRKGLHEVWARVGYEFARSELDWRIDSGEFSTLKPDALTTDLMAIADWAEVAWVKLGVVELAAGDHELEVRIRRPVRQQGGNSIPERLLVGLDCFCISPTVFRPNGPHKPGSAWQTEKDIQAADHGFPVVEPASESERAETPLAGTWQVARWDEQELVGRDQPALSLPVNYDSLHWSAINVPGNRDSIRPDLQYCHRFVYRTHVDVPASLQGRSFVLKFPCTSMLASLFVNGQLAASSDTPTVAWSADVTDYIQTGRRNEICVVVKDVYYALEQDGQGRSARYLFNLPPDMFYNAGGLGVTRYADFPVLFQVRASGILETPSLMVCGSVYVTDLFIKTSVAKQTLTVEFNVRNNRNDTVAVRIDAGASSRKEAPVKNFSKEERIFGQVIRDSISARSDKPFVIEESWASPKLWWPGEPNMYNLIINILSGPQPIDTSSTPFGFREWTWSGPDFKLNGVPYRLRADLDHAEPTDNPDAALASWAKHGQNMFRFWGIRPWTGKSQAETLDYFDHHGVAVRRSGIFDGQVASYLLVEDVDGKTVPRKRLFDNWIRQLRAWVKAERNHPSIMIWSLENEITYINTRNFGWLDAVEPEIRRAAEAVMADDPTRPVMIDGGDALRDRSLPVYGNHYNEAAWREYPDESYTFANALTRHTSRGDSPWPIGFDRPLFLGESFFAMGRPPAAYAQFGGDAAFLGRVQSRDGVGVFARMLAEGYRYSGVAAVHFWLDGKSANHLHYPAWSPIAVLFREWDSTFLSASTATRTFKVFNDTRAPATIEAKIELRVKGAVVADFKESNRYPAGATVEKTASFKFPRVTEPTDAEFRITATTSRQVVFNDIKPVVILPSPLPRTQFSAGQLAVWDPNGREIEEHLRQLGVNFTSRASPDEIDPSADIILVGSNALDQVEATSSRWQALAASGRKVLVLDQSSPLQFQGAPADLEPTGFSGSIAFIEDATHPVFVGLKNSNFFCWSGNHRVYRNAYRKPTRGGRSLLQCDEELSCTSLVEMPVESGMILAAQLDLGRKLRNDPVAQKLFVNLLDYAAGYTPAAKSTALLFNPDSEASRLLNEMGLRAETVSSVAAALYSAPPAADAKGTAKTAQKSKATQAKVKSVQAPARTAPIPGNAKSFDVVIMEATPQNLEALASAKSQLDAFTARGGTLMLWGLTPNGLESFNRVVNVEHAIRPFRMERVTLAAERDPILAGLTVRDVALESSEQIFPWSGDRYPASDVFTYVVDLEDIAPFAKCPTQEEGWKQMTNGLVSADAWKFIFSHNLTQDSKPAWTIELPKTETITEFSITPNTFYHHITELKLTFDGRERDALTLNLAPEMERQNFGVQPPRTARSITLTPAKWTEVGSQPVVSIENVWIRAARNHIYQQTVVPLLNIGALVKYRRGAGSIILNQVALHPAESNPINADKKRNLLGTLLRNLGCTFSSSGSVIPGAANLDYTPIEFNELCNQYLNSEKGWFTGEGDLSAFPLGDQKLAGVRYRIRDFRTSPLPACIMLAGEPARGTLPEAVKNIPINRTADALFFLHTAQLTREWQRPGNSGDNPAAAVPPVVFQYTVRYADGEESVVPVRYGSGVGPWKTDKPAGLPEAAVAWQAPLSKTGESAASAVVYQQTWTNPRPEVPIASIDLGYPEGERWGVPAVLGITAASRKK